MYEGLLGEKVDYRLLDYSCEEDIIPLNDIFLEVQGLSITSPYKKHFLNSVKMSPEIERLGAINCIYKKDKSFYATNTDYLAVKKILSDKYNSKDIVLLGSGVMASITKNVLSELKLPFTQYSRSTHGDLNQVNLSGSNKLIINSCSRSFVFKNKLDPDSIFWDYNYSYDPHIEYFCNLDIEYVDGLEMLRLQAKYALKFWEILE